MAGDNYATFRPTGDWEDPCLVTCRVCAYTAMAPDWMAAARLVIAHNRHHDNHHDREAACVTDVRSSS